MIKARIQVEEMHVYYFIAKKLISAAKLGIFGMTSGEERLLKKIYCCSDIDSIDNLVKQISDRLEEKQAKLDRLVLNSDDTKQFITEAVDCTGNLRNKEMVLENVLKFLKVEFTTSQKITLCIEKIVQAKRILAGLSPEEKKTFLSEVNFDFKKCSNFSMKVTAVDAENINNKKTALVDNVTGEKLVISNVPVIDDNKGNIINNNIDNNIVKINDKKVQVIADTNIEVLDKVETLDEVEELLENNVSNTTNYLKQNISVESNNVDTEILEEIVSENDNSVDILDDSDTRESIDESYVGVMADNFDVDPLDYYSVGSSIYDKDVLEYNIPTIEPAYEIIGNFKKDSFGDVFDRQLVEDDLENSIPIIEEFSNIVVNDKKIESLADCYENSTDFAVTNEVQTISYDEPVIFKVIETDGVPLE